MPKGARRNQIYCKAKCKQAAAYRRKVSGVIRMKNQKAGKVPAPVINPPLPNGRSRITKLPDAEPVATLMDGFVPVDEVQEMLDLVRRQPTLRQIQLEVYGGESGEYERKVTAVIEHYSLYHGLRMVPA